MKRLSIVGMCLVGSMLGAMNKENVMPIFYSSSAQQMVEHELQKNVSKMMLRSKVRNRDLPHLSEDDMIKGQEECFLRMFFDLFDLCEQCSPHIKNIRNIVSRNEKLRFNLDLLQHKRKSTSVFKFIDAVNDIVIESRLNAERCQGSRVQLEGLIASLYTRLESINKKLKIRSGLGSIRNYFNHYQSCKFQTKTEDARIKNVFDTMDVLRGLSWLTPTLMYDFICPPFLYEYCFTHLQNLCSKIDVMINEFIRLEFIPAISCLDEALNKSLWEEHEFLGNDDGPLRRAYDHLWEDLTEQISLIFPKTRVSVYRELAILNKKQTDFSDAFLFMTEAVYSLPDDMDGLSVADKVLGGRKFKRIFDSYVMSSAEERALAGRRVLVDKIHGGRTHIDFPRTSTVCSSDSKCYKDNGFGLCGRNNEIHTDLLEFIDIWVNSMSAEALNRELISSINEQILTFIYFGMMKFSEAQQQEIARHYLSAKEKLKFPGNNVGVLREAFELLQLFVPKPKQNPCQPTKPAVFRRLNFNQS